MEKKSPRILGKLSKGSTKNSKQPEVRMNESSGASLQPNSLLATSSSTNSVSLNTKELKRAHEKQLKLQQQLAKQEAKFQKKQAKLQAMKTEKLAKSGIDVRTTESGMASNPAISSASVTLSAIETGDISTEEAKFIEGMQFRGKLIGIEPVLAARGDTVCRNAFKNLRLRRTTSGHKQRITINIKMTGVQLLDQKTGDLIANHTINFISYITRDTQDERAFGYVYGTVEVGYQLIAIKTEKNAIFVMSAIEELFTYVYKKKCEKQMQMTQPAQVQLQPTSSQANPTQFQLSQTQLKTVQTPPITTQVQLQPLQVPLPSTQVSLPSTQVPLSSAQVQLPPTQVQLPPTQVQLPPTQIQLSSSQVQLSSSQQPPLLPHQIPQTSSLVLQPTTITQTTRNVMLQPQLSQVELPKVEQPKDKPFESATVALFGSEAPPPPPLPLPRNSIAIYSGAQLKKPDNFTQEAKINAWPSKIANKNQNFATWQNFTEEDTIGENKWSDENFVEDWPQNSPPKFPPPQLEMKTASINMAVSAPAAQLASGLIKLSTPPSAVRRRPRRTSDSCKSTSSQTSSIADNTSLDLQSAVLDSTDKDSSSTLRQQVVTATEMPSSATLCVGSGRRAAGEDSAEASCCTSKMDSASSVFSASSLGSPLCASPGISKSTGDLTCEVITNQLQNMSAQLDEEASKAFDAFPSLDDVFNQSCPVNSTMNLNHSEEQKAKISNDWAANSFNSSFSNESGFGLINNFTLKENSSRDSEDKYAVFSQPEVLQSTSIFDPLFNPKDSMLNQKTEKKVRATHEKSSTKLQEDMPNSKPEAKSSKQIQSDEPAFEKSNENDDNIYEEIRIRKVSQEKPMSENAETSESKWKDIHSSSKRSSFENRSASSSANVDLFSIDPLDSFASFSLSTAGSIALSIPEVGEDDALEVSSVSSSDPLNLLERQFERAKMQLQAAQRVMQKQHLQQQQKLIQQQKQQQLEFSRQMKFRMQQQCGPNPALRAQQQLQQRRLQQQFVQQQQWLKQLQQTQQMQLLDQLQTLQQAYLERKISLLRSQDSPEEVDVPNIFECSRGPSLSMLNLFSGLDPLGDVSAPSSLLSQLSVSSANLTNTGSFLQPHALSSFQLSASSSPLQMADRCSTSCSLASNSSHNPFLLLEDECAHIHNNTSDHTLNSNRASRLSSRSEDALLAPAGTGDDQFQNKSCNATFASALGLQNDSSKQDKSFDISKSFEQPLTDTTPKTPSSDPFNCSFVDSKLCEFSRISQLRHQTQQQLIGPLGGQSVTSMTLPRVASTISSSNLRNDCSTLMHPSNKKSTQNHELFDQSPFEPNLFASFSNTHNINLSDSKKSNIESSSNRQFNQFTTEKVSPPERNIFQVRSDPFEDDFFH